MAETVRECCSRRLASMKSAREPFEREWKDIAKYAAPSRTRFLNTEGKRKRSPILLDEHGIFAFRTLTGGMTSGLSSPSRPWFALSTSDDLMQGEGVKEWLSDVTARMYEFFAESNFYGAARTGYSELGLFGTEACVMVEHGDNMVCHALSAGEYWIATGEDLKVDTLYRRAPMTVRQAMSFFKDKASKRINDLASTGRLDDELEIYHAIEPRSDYDRDKIDNINMPWRSVYWDAQDDSKTVITESGYPEQPFWAPRWDTLGNDAWGYSPGMDALPSLRELQLQVKRRNEAVDQLVKPEKVANATVKLTGQPGNVVSVPNVSDNLVMVPYQLPYQAVTVIANEVQNCKEQISRAAHADTFMAITDIQGGSYKNMDEIASRNEEKFTQLGPVVERVNNDKLAVAVNRVFGIMARKQLLPPMPPELTEAGGLDIQFVSMLTQMQRAVGVSQIERGIGFVGNLLAAFPEAGDNLNVDEGIKEYFERIGTPAKLTRTDEEVEKIRADRAQAAQQEKVMAAAPAARDGAEAARLLSETDVGGQSMLDRMMPAQ